MAVRHDTTIAYFIKLWKVDDEWSRESGVEDRFAFKAIILNFKR